MNRMNNKLYTPDKYPQKLTAAGSILNANKVPKSTFSEPLTNPRTLSSHEHS